MVTKKSAKKGVAAKKSASSRKVSSAAQPESTDAAAQFGLDMQVDLTEMATASGQTVDQHPRPISPSLIFPVPLPPIVLDECGAGSFTCQRSTIATTGSNNDETDFPDRIGNYHKGLPHNGLGEVVPAAYQTLLDATVTPTPGEFPAIRTTIGANCGRKLTNPQSGLATDREGPTTSNMKMRSAPKVNSREAAAEAVELYWMALLRDVHFTQFANNDLVETAAAELSGLTDFTGPKIGGRVTPESIFRGCSRGNEVGPLLSQFLLKDIPYGSLLINQRQQTVVGEEVVGAGNADYLTKYSEWLAIQNGKTNFPSDMLDGTRRYIRNMRDIGQYVHVDALYEAYLNACLILLSLGTPVDDGNPYKDPPALRPNSRNQIGFGTFGGPHILSLVCEVATRALKAVWWQKWFVHRRLRPEAYGGLVHHTKNGTKAYPVDSQVLNSDAVARTFSKYGSYLLPQAFPEGSPTHPAYGAGHATVAGACVTVLKAWFDENAPITNPVVASDDGLSLVPYTGGDAGRLTVGGELNKVAANIAIGRNMAGVHWRSDYFDSIRLGERVAICILSNQRNDYFELPDWSFTFTSFDNETVRISKAGVTGKKPGFTPCTDRNIDVL